jgi:hypothetical protein
MLRNAAMQICQHLREARAIEPKKNRLDECSRPQYLTANRLLDPRAKCSSRTRGEASVCPTVVRERKIHLPVMFDSGYTPYAAMS